jgi:hypothetical protein
MNLSLKRPLGRQTAIALHSHQSMKEIDRSTQYIEMALTKSK